MLRVLVIKSANVDQFMHAVSVRSTREHLTVRYWEDIPAPGGTLHHLTTRVFDWPLTLHIADEKSDESRTA